MHERGLLEQLEKGPVSGDALARRAGVTRAAIWKRIDALRAAGVEIDAAPGHGYRLRQPLALLDAATIQCGLPGEARGELAALEVAWTLDSTNNELLRRGPPASGTAVLFAECQTEGRGRRGRGWTSPLAGHVSLSLARRFAGGLARLGGLSLVAGVAAAGALRDLGVRGIGLKWPNDLVVRDGHGLRKLGGILVEGGGEHAGPAHAVIGVGVNVRLPGASGAAIDQPWIDLAGCLDGARGGAIDRNAVAAALLARMLPALAGFDRAGLAPFLEPYAAFDMLAGREVVVRDGTREHVGIACGLAADGGLSLALPSGETRVFHAGEASVRSR